MLVVGGFVVFASVVLIVVTTSMTIGDIHEYRRDIELAKLRQCKCKKEQS